MKLRKHPKNSASLKHVRFDSAQIVTFAVIFGIIGSYILWKSYAAEAPPGSSVSNSSIPASVPAGNLSFGDVNGDEKVDSLDLSLLLDHFGTDDPNYNINGQG